MTCITNLVLCTNFNNIRLLVKVIDKFVVVI